MSGGLTLQLVQDADPNRVQAAAEHWLALAVGLDDAAEELIRGSRDLEHVWPSGPAAQAAWQRGAQLRAEVSNAEQPCRRIGRALYDHAGTLRALQERIREVAASAVGQGLTVDIATGTVSASEAMYAKTDKPHLIAQQVSGYVGQFQSILEQAAELDASTANLINVNLPDPKTGFGTTSLAPVSEQTLRDQKGRNPADVKAWWDSLTPEQQEQAIADYPELVGWLDGVPATDRDTANRITLDKNVKDLRNQDKTLADRDAYLRSMADQGRLAEVYPNSPNPVGMMYTELDDIKNKRDDIAHRLTGPTAILDRSNDTGKPPIFLLGYDPSGDGKAIVSVGNPDLAANVVTYVPGTKADLPGIDGDMKRADVMASDANQLDRYHPTAAITWLGYDAPDWFNNAASESYAQDAADDLRSFESGLRATHEGDTKAHSTVIGHSYGTTAVGYAARDGHLAVDDVIFVGSPGVGVDHAADLHIDGGTGNVWASTAEHDIIRATGITDDKRFGQSPATSEFGGKVFSSAPGGFFDRIATHSAYWDKGNPSRDNIAHIVTGQYGGVN